MIDLLGVAYFIILVSAEVLKIAFYVVGLWMLLKWIGKN